MIEQDSLDPLDIMNSVMLFETEEFNDDWSIKSIAYERKVAALCEIIVEKNKRIAELEKDLNKVEEEIWTYFWENFK